MQILPAKRAKVFNPNVIEFLKDSKLKDMRFTSKNEINKIADQMNEIALGSIMEGLSKELYEVRGRMSAAGVRIRCKQARCRFDLRFRGSRDQNGAVTYRVGQPLTLSHCAIFH